MEVVTHTAEKGLAFYQMDWRDPTAEDVLAFVRLQYRAGKARRQLWEYEAAERLAWVRGEQHTLLGAEQLAERGIDPSVAARMQARDAGMHERFAVSINLIKRFVLGWLSLVLGQPVTFQVRAATAAQDDVGAARMATAVLQYYWRCGGTLGSVLDLLWMVAATGFALLKPSWDPLAGEMLEAPKGGNGTGRGVLNRVRGILGLGESEDQGQQPFRQQQGDVVLDWVSGFELTEPEGCRRLRKAPWLLESRWISMAEGRERYGSKWDEVQPDSRSSDYRHHLFPGSLGIANRAGDAQSTAPDELVLRHELWIPKSPRYPKGYYAIVASDKLVRSGPHPYAHGEHPYIPVTMQPDPEFIRPGCDVLDLLPLQAARNWERSAVLGHLHKTINPRVMVEDDVNLPAGALDRDGPTLIPVPVGTLSENKIKNFELAALPGYAFGLDQANRTDMEDVAGIHRSTLGGQESAQQSGRHAALMTQGDARTALVSRLLLQEAFAEAGQQLLWLLREHVTTQRMLTIYGPEGEPDVISFTGEQLSAHEPRGPYRFNIIATLTAEPDMQQVLAKVQTLTEMGWISPQREEDRLIVQKWLGEDVARQIDAGAADRANAALENRRLLKGEKPTVSRGDDHAVHGFEHRRFMTTPQWQEGAAAAPALEALLLEHIATHSYEAAYLQLEPAAIAEKVKRELVAKHGLVPTVPAPQPPIGAAPVGAA